MTFTAEEIFSKVDNKKDSIYLNNWFETSINITNQEIELFNDLYSIKSDVSRLIEEARNDNKVGSSLECKLEINCNKNLYDKIKPLENELKFIFITSECHLKLSDSEFDHPIKRGDDELTIIITKSVNTKCERCWHLNESVGKIKDTPTICQRCFDNVHGDGECRAYA